MSTDFHSFGAQGISVSLDLRVGHIRELMIEREGRANPGARLAASCPPDVGEAAKLYLPDLARRIGARFSLDVRLGAPRGRIDVRAL